MNPREAVYVPMERDTVREASCPFCWRINYLYGVSVVGGTQEQVASISSTLCDHFAAIDRNHSGTIKAIIFQEKI